MKSEFENITPEELLNEYNVNDCLAQDLADKYGVTRNKILRKLNKALKE